MHMKKSIAALVILSSAAMAASASASVLIYEPFAPASDGTGYASGSAITGQNNTTSAAAETWQLAGPAAALHVVGGASLSPSAAMLAAGFPASVGNDADLKKSGTSSAYDRLSIPNAFSGITPVYGSGSQLYYSLLLSIPDITGLTIPHTNTAAANDGLVSFNNTQGSTSTAPSTFFGELNIRLGSTAGTYNLGIHASTTDAGGTYWTGDITPSATPLFIVAELQLGIGNTNPNVAANDLQSIWVNPNPSTLGLSEALRPAADGSSDGSNSASAVAAMESIVIGAGIATAGAAPNDTFIDELRVGNTWADVTPVPEPTTLSLLGLGAIAGMARRRRIA
jgi:PEP-CTERM motif